ncbi:fluoride ion exporter CrcB/FEX [Rhizobium sp. BK313]|uniref:hypothetical protein n=1 Tax=Rhizobium sp. BK313 TaxID=2587081 RepID=UPI0016165173|nr:hypothetical protein [Rhizobium sp. BK313]MBB3453906.1 fluoride ion exporter CrcB/FEX [Rhizobium sp. BK313]
MNDNQRLHVIIGSVWAWIYVIGCFAAGIALHNAWAWKLALVTGALCYLTNLSQFMDGMEPSDVLRNAAILFFLLSIVSGFAAGIVLLVV